MRLKNLLALIFMFFFAGNGMAQRFLTTVFENVSHTLDITYGNALNYLGDEEVLLLDFFEPELDTMILRPLVIYIHGGGFTDVAQTKSLVHIAAFCDSLALRGYTAASINYRLDTSISNRAVINAMQDAKAAVRFFKANRETYKIDTNLIFIAGESAGAITALNVNYMDQSEETSYPNTLPLSDDLSVEGNSGNLGFGSTTKATLCFCGGTKTVLVEPTFDTLSMENSENPPLLMVHGTADPIIPIANALEIAIRAENIGLPNLFYTFSGATHCPWFFPLENSWNYLDSLIDYAVPFLYACIEEPLGLKETKFQAEFLLYPNPAFNHLKFNLNEQVEVYEIGGKLVFKGEVAINELMDISNWQKGLYIVFFPEINQKIKLIKMQ